MVGATLDCIYFDVLFFVQVSLPLIRLCKIICAIVMTRLNIFQQRSNVFIAIKWYCYIVSFSCFTLFYAVTGLLISRTQERRPMLLESCLQQRLKGIWKMFWSTNKPFPFDAFVVVLVELLRQRTVIQMVKDAGLLNRLNLFLTYLRMLRAMQKYVLLSLIFYSWFDFFKPSEKLCQPLMQVKGLDVDSLHISHIQVNQAQKQRRRTYRAHGRINREFFPFFAFFWVWVGWACGFVLNIILLFLMQPICHHPAILS